MRSFVALVLVSSLVAACGGRGSRTPAWPRMAEREADGGESLEPRQASAVVEASDDKAAEKKAEAPATVTEAKPTEAKPAEAATPTLGTPVVAPEEVIDIDDIVIEIED